VNEYGFSHRFFRLLGLAGSPLLAQDALTLAIVDAGAVRFRPMMLTAAAGITCYAVILFDPIFQGLAIAFIAGE
jgi:multidrug efflux pump subunit AcrB